MTLSIVSSGLDGSTGSCSKTSSPAPAMMPARKASMRAASSATGPRAMFTKKASRFMSAKRRAFMRWRVSALSKQVASTKSACGSMASRGSSSAPSAPSATGSA